VIPLGLAAFLLLSTRPAAGHLRQQASASRAEAAINPSPQWVDDIVGEGEVAYLYTAGSDVFNTSRTMLEVTFWNPTVNSVVALAGSEECQLPERRAHIDPATGRIVTADGGGLPRHVVGEAGLELAGKPLARQGPLVLYQVIEPVTLRQSVEGVYSDGWMGSDALYTRYTGTRRGRAIVALSREFYTPETMPSAVRIDVGPLVLGKDGMPRVGRPTVTRRWTIEPGARRRFSIRAPKPPFRVSVHIENTFPAAGFGGSDPRQLGAQVDFGFKS
jgi:hypothetical protein